MSGKKEINRKRRKQQQKRAVIAITCVLVAAAATLITVTALHKDGIAETDEAQTADSQDGGTVTWQGKRYVYNDHLSNYLLIGVDKREQVETSEGQADAGQADAIYLVSWDRVENTLTRITIPRDTMTNIETFLPSGESAGYSMDHLSLAYSFGDGGHESCRLTKEAVSKLFYGLPIQSYCALNMDGLPALTQSVGSVTVTVPNDSLAAKYPEFQEGAQVTITPENTETFVRYRDINVSQSALARTERQQAYLTAFTEAAKAKFAQDPGYASDLYLSLKPYMVTSMSTDQFVSLAESAAKGKTLEGWTVPGEGVEGEAYDEYHVDDNALYAKIIETFYKEADSK